MQTSFPKVLSKIEKLKFIKKLRFVGILVVIFVTSIFFTKTLTQYYEQFQTSLLSISPLRVIIAFVLFIGYLCLRALSWRQLVNFLGENVNKTNSLSVWFFSEATRYIPGNIWSFVSRAYFARQEHVSRNASLLVLPIEVMTVASVASALSLYAISKNLERLPVNFFFYSTIILTPVALLAFLLLQKIIRRIFGKLGEVELKPKALLAAILLQLACWSLYSLGTIVLIDGKIDNFPLIYSSTILAWLVGYLSLVTPMGLGVRESAFVLLVGGVIGAAQAVLIAIVSRVILINSELAILLFLVSKKRFTR